MAKRSPSPSAVSWSRRPGRMARAGVVVGAPARAGGRATLSPEDGLEGGRVADDGDEDVGGFGDGAGRGSEARSRGNQRLRAGGGAVPDGEGKAGLQQIQAHGRAHEAQTDEADGGF